MPAKKKTNEKNIIPVLFTLGVIGWGFFAIDRLTVSGNKETEPVQYRNIEKKNNTGNSSSVSKFFKSVFSGVYEDDILNHPAPTAQKTEKIPSPPNAESHEEESGDKNVKIYMYRLDKTDQPALTWKNVTVEDKNMVSTAFHLLLKPPAEGEDFIDSFPNRPELDKVVMKDGVIHLYFDSSFIHGNSLEMIRFQVRQLLATARQFEGVSGIKIFISGTNISRMGVDGLHLPETITRI